MASLCDVMWLYHDTGAFKEVGWDPLSWRHWISGSINGFSFAGRWIFPACCWLSCPWPELLWSLGLPLMCKQKSVLQLWVLTTLSEENTMLYQFPQCGIQLASGLHQNGSCILLDCARNFSVCSISSGLKSSLGRGDWSLGPDSRRAVLLEGLRPPVVSL